MFCDIFLVATRCALRLALRFMDKESGTRKKERGAPGAYTDYMLASASIYPSYAVLLSIKSFHNASKTYHKNAKNITRYVLIK